MHLLRRVAKDSFMKVFSFRRNPYLDVSATEWEQDAETSYLKDHQGARRPAGVDF